MVTFFNVCHLGNLLNFLTLTELRACQHWNDSLTFHHQHFRVTSAGLRTPNNSTDRHESERCFRNHPPFFQGQSIYFNFGRDVFIVATNPEYLFPQLNSSHLTCVSITDPHLVQLMELHNCSRNSLNPKPSIFQRRPHIPRKKDIQIWAHGLRQKQFILRVGCWCILIYIYYNIYYIYKL